PPYLPTLSLHDALPILPSGGCSDGSSSGAGTPGLCASVSAQVSRPTPVTAVAVTIGLSPWWSSSIQCWLERLVTTGRAVIMNGPSASGAAKFTVNATGEP